ncbi:MAG: sulfatase family protein [Planctomycetota bacterium]|jgi:arylsulfatase A-like enzyme
MAKESMTRRDVLKAGAVGSAGGVVASAARMAKAADGGRKPNIVFLFADQMAGYCMGCAGDDQAITPHLDRLAGEGVRVSNMIAAQPVCTPYRAQLMTGKYGHTTGVVHNDIKLPNEETCVAELMSEAGYQTGYIGKWHLAGHRQNPVDMADRQGWDYWAVRNCSHAHMNPEYWLNDSDESIKVDGWEPDVQTDLAVDYIKEHRDEPFCLYVSYGPPHNPYKAPPEYVARYDDVDLKLRANAPVTEKNRKDQLQYYAMVTSLDDCVGRIDAALKEAGVVEDTVLIFTADHGDMLGSQGHKLKQRPWEESINVPFVLRYPRKVEGGRDRDWIVSSVDLMPTLLGFCCVDPPRGVQGVDQSGLFIEDGGELREDAFLFNVHNGGGPGCDWRGIRTKRWSYAYHMEGDWILYDLKNDPYQLKNLIDDPKYAKVKAKLAARLEEMRREVGENRPLVGRLPAPIQLPG